MQSIDQQIDITKPVHLKQKVKYVEYAPNNVIQQFSLDSNSTAQFQISVDTNAINWCQSGLILELGVPTAGAANSQVYLRNKGPIKRISFRTGSGQLLYQVENYLDAFATGYPLRHKLQQSNQSDDFKVKDNARGLAIVDSLDNDNNYEYINGNAAATFQIYLPFEKFDIPDKFLKLQDSILLIEVEFKPVREYIGRRITAQESDKVALTGNFTVNKLVMRCCQNWDQEINQMLKELYLDSPLPYDYVSTYFRTVQGTNFNMNLPITQSMGQKIKGFLISVLDSEQKFDAATDVDTENYSQFLPYQSLEDDFTLKQVQVYWDSEILETDNQPLISKNKIRNTQQHKRSLQWYFDLGDGKSVDSGSEFGSEQAKNLQINITSLANNSNPVICVHIIGQKYLVQKPGTVFIQ